MSPLTELKSEYRADFNLAESAAGIRCTQCHDLILVDFNLVVGQSICQIKISGYTVSMHVCHSSVPYPIV